MIDTLRLRGPADMVNFEWDYEQFTGFKNKKTGTRYVSSILVKKTPQFRAMYYPASNSMDVEINIHKTMFGFNVYNYASSAGILNSLVRNFAYYFYRPSSDIYVTRCDIGGVSTFKDVAESYQVLEKYRRCKFPGARIGKWRMQNYPDSVWYDTRHWSIKIYNKGKELGELADDFKEFDLFSTLRFEKTYRFREMGRLGMNIKAHYGVNLEEFDTDILLKDFFGLISGWELAQTPYLTDNKGAMGLLSVIDKLGYLSEIHAFSTVSRSTIHRYNKLKKADVPEFQQNVVFPFNLPPEKLSILNYARTFVPASFFT